VIATCSTPEKAEVARAAGAVAVLDYNDISREVRSLTDGDGVACVYDGVGATTFDESLASLRHRGMLALYGAASGPVPPFDSQRLNTAGSIYLTRPNLAHYVATRQELVDRYDDLFDMIRRGALKTRIGGRYPLAEAYRAHTDLEDRRTSGKLLLIPN
jgi:NADPH2:quinone reductase